MQIQAIRKLFLAYKVSITITKKDLKLSKALSPERNQAKLTTILLLC